MNSSKPAGKTIGEVFEVIAKKWRPSHAKALKAEVAAACEEAYRRGYQQGVYAMRKKPETVRTNAEILNIRFKLTLNRAPFLEKGSSTSAGCMSAVERLERARPQWRLGE